MAPPPMPLLLPFCQFLLHRLQTDNFELLQRAASEFLGTPPRFETVDAMVRLAFPLVAVLPVDNPDAGERARADAILARMRSSGRDDAAAEFAPLRAALATRVELKNWDWLEQILFEFCAGQDECLRQFVATQRQAISIVPLRSQTVEPVRAPATTGRLRVACPKTKRRSYDDKSAVLAELLALEKQRPWEAVFDVTKIEYPFEETAHPQLAVELKTFWQRHARAVWERLFWFYYGSPDDHTSRQEDRKNRQDAASRSFEARVMERCYEAFGPTFFVDLDLRPQRHYWWWYREPVIDMLRMGSDRCLQYLRTKAFERFPDPPPGLELRAHRHSSKEVRSYWAALAKYQDQREEIEKLKKARLAGAA